MWAPHVILFFLPPTSSPSSSSFFGLLAPLALLSQPKHTAAYLLHRTGSCLTAELWSCMPNRLSAPPLKTTLSWRRRPSWSSTAHGFNFLLPSPLGPRRWGPRCPEAAGLQPSFFSDAWLRSRPPQLSVSTASSWSRRRKASHSSPPQPSPWPSRLAPPASSLSRSSSSRCGATSPCISSSTLPMAEMTRCRRSGTDIGAPSRHRRQRRALPRRKRREEEEGERRGERKGKGGRGKRMTCGAHMSVGPTIFFHVWMTCQSYVFLFFVFTLMPQKLYVNDT